MSGPVTQTGEDYSMMSQELIDLEIEELELKLQLT